MFKMTEHSQADAPRSTEVPLDWLWTFLSAAGIAFFFGWVEWSPKTLGPWTIEDGPIENLSAVLFFLGGVGFLVAAKRSEYLRSRNARAVYIFMILWAMICFVCSGEEISWGQRILGFDTPEQIKALNAQEELTFHNLYAIAETGGTYRMLSIFILGTGLFIPAIASTASGLRLARRWGFPVAPWVLLPAFVGAYLFGVYYINISPNADIKPANAINEAREFLIGYAMALYGLLAAWAPQVLFRLPTVARSQAEQT
jgi:hypothetical protein